MICYTTVSPGPGAHKDHLGETSFLIWTFRPHTRSQTTRMVAQHPHFLKAARDGGGGFLFDLSPLPPPRDPTHGRCSGSVVLTTGLPVIGAGGFLHFEQPSPRYLAGPPHLQHFPPSDPGTGIMVSREHPGRIRSRP